MHAPVNAQVDAVFVLSVRSFHDRIAHIQSELRHHGIEFEWIFEHDANELTSELIESTFAPSDMGRAQQSLVLDEGFDVLVDAARMQGLAAGNVVFDTVPVLGDGDSESDGSVLKADPQAVRAFIAGAIEAPPPTDSTPAGPPAKATITVDVFNGSAVTGLAKAVAEQLTGQGFPRGTVGNTPARATSVVHFPTGAPDTARMVADALGGLPIEEDTHLPAGTVQVYLGKDYSGPGKPRIAGASLPRVGTAA
ncbi:MAG: LytR C-terminal domain-containing protein, partial [Burkholderiaceae bacterium]